MKNFSILIVAFLLSLFLFSCQKTDSNKENLQTDQTSITISEEQLSFISGWAGAKKESYKVKDFDVIYNDLQLLVDIVNRNREKFEKDSIPCIVIQYNPLRFGTIALSDANAESLTRVMKAFPSNSAILELITVHPDRISFATINRLYALVYTEDDSEPQFMTWPDENKKISVEKIQPHWYHVFAD